ncbi:MAG: hypothetical protein EAZ85_04765 [Bacteroidetes bacterium]|nr:MAG: hypothetical protein EAZ85_04765 [Bacteroidota bacterium]TAG90203.1 MAG: hypothetical protein EAZ20_04960 [Bacteroidota bacterium]
MLQNFSSLSEYMQLMLPENIVLSYKGPITTSLISGLNQEIQTKFKDNPRINRKLTSIYMELAQNIFYYSVEINQFGEGDKVGMIVVSQDIDNYYLITGNLIETKQGDFLKQQAEKINSLDVEGLRKYRLEIVESPINPQSKGAGVGLIKACLVSENAVGVDIQMIDEHLSFYTIIIKIKK